MMTPGLRLIWPPSGSTCASSSIAEPLGDRADVALLARHAQRRIGQRDGDLQRRRAVARFRRVVAQEAHLLASGCA